MTGPWLFLVCSHLNGYFSLAIIKQCRLTAMLRYLIIDSVLAQSYRTHEFWLRHLE